MAALLTIAAVIAALMLSVSAAGAFGRHTGRGATGRGPWGIAEFESTRRRPLNAQERRWQTLLIAARENEPRWREFIEEFERLEHAAEGVQHSARPQSFDAAWIEDRLNHLESIAARTTASVDAPGVQNR